MTYIVGLIWFGVWLYSVLDRLVFVIQEYAKIYWYCGDFKSIKKYKNTYSRYTKNLNLYIIDGMLLRMITLYIGIKRGYSLEYKLNKIGEKLNRQYKFFSERKDYAQYLEDNKAAV